MLLLVNVSACRGETGQYPATDLMSENQYETVSFTHGKSLKTGDYIQFGSYQVEDEGYNPILWTVIDATNHYAGYVSPEAEHITLISEYVIDLRGFDAVEPENNNELRRGYGNGRYRTSNIRQWLNSSGDENNWWTAQNLDDGGAGTNNADAPPSDEGFPDFNGAGYEDKAGFLKSFTTGELEKILDTMLTAGKNNAVDGGGSEDVTDKIFLLSLTEVGLGDRSEYEEGKIIDFFENGQSGQAEITDKCIENTKCLNSSPVEKYWSWWLRTPSPGFPASTFIVSSIGAALNSTANMSEGPVGIRPALNLKTDLFFTGSGTEDNPYVIAEDEEIDAALKDRILKEAEIAEETDREGRGEDSESYESDETKIVVEENLKLSGGDKLLQTACLDAAGDYPEWAAESGSMVIWMGLEKNKEVFFIRQSPDYPSIGIQSPAEKISKGRIAALDFIDRNTAGYAVVSQNGKCVIGLLQFKFTGAGANISCSYHTIYEKDGVASVRDISFINKDEFIIFYVSESRQGQERAAVRYINARSSKEEVLLEFDMMPYDEGSKAYNVPKVSVSPQGTYAYIIYNSASTEQGTLAVFDISDRDKMGEMTIKELDSVLSAVWIGNKHILYSSLEGGGKVSIYDVESDKSYGVTGVNKNAVDLSFCPESGGVIIYNTDPLSYQAEAHALSCGNWEELGRGENSIFNAIADIDTVIISKYDKAQNNMPADFKVWEGGYFSLKFKSGRHLCDEFLTNYQKSVLATAWSRY